MALTISGPLSIPSAAPDGAGGGARVPGTARGAGRSCTPANQWIARELWKRFAGCSCAATASSFATCSRETLLPAWRELLITLRRLEDRGEVRGGRFVSGFLGEQFALPVAVESLRTLRNLPPSGETIAVSAADPVNLAGILVPGEANSSTSGRFVAFRDGVALPPPERAGIVAMAAAR